MRDAEYAGTITLDAMYEDIRAILEEEIVGMLLVAKTENRLISFSRCKIFQVRKLKFRKIKLKNI